MAYFPIGVPLEGKACLVVGGGSVAASKTAALLDFGARITVVAPETDLRFEDLKDKFPDGLIMMNRTYEEKDVEDCYLVVAATGNRQVNHAVADACGKAGILVNVADEPQECTFFFPAIVHKGDVTVTVSTSGESPLLSRFIRQEIQRDLPEHLDEIVESMEKYRDLVIEQVPDVKVRKKVFEKLLRLSFDQEEELTAQQVNQILYDYR